MAHGAFIPALSFNVLNIFKYHSSAKAVWSVYDEHEFQNKILERLIDISTNVFRTILCVLVLTGKRQFRSLYAYCLRENYILR